MAIIFTDLELDDDSALDMAVPCTAEPSKKLLPQYPWGTRLSLETDTLDKLNFHPNQTGGMVHIHGLARITAISDDQRQDGTNHRRVELQIEQMAIESEDKENDEADAAMDKTSRRANRTKVLYGRESD